MRRSASIFFMIVMWTYSLSPAVSAKGLHRTGPIGQSVDLTRAQIEAPLIRKSSSNQLRSFYRKDLSPTVGDRDVERGLHRPLSKTLSQKRELRHVEKNSQRAASKSELSEPQIVYGTGKDWIRLGNLLNGAEEKVASGDVRAASLIAREANTLLDDLKRDLPISSLEDPQVLGNAARLRDIDKQLTSNAQR